MNEAQFPLDWNWLRAKFENNDGCYVERFVIAINLEKTINRRVQNKTILIAMVTMKFSLFEMFRKV